MLEQHNNMLYEANICQVLSNLTHSIYSNNQIIHNLHIARMVFVERKLYSVII
jgi:hypothetical protein